MIISASRRTDIPAFYGSWMLRRLQEGYAQTANPYRPSQVRRVDLRQPAVTALVFWTKDPRPFLAELEHITAMGYPFVVQFCLTPYGSDLETALKDKSGLPAVMRFLAEHYGRERINWRYDPILISPRYDAAFHIRAFEQLSQQLAGSASRCIISFLDPYPHLAKLSEKHAFRPPEPQERQTIGQAFARLARKADLPLQSCCEPLTPAESGIEKAGCIDIRQIKEISGLQLSAVRDRNQRPGCLCAPSVDLGAYETCLHGCAYCYATRSHVRARSNHDRHSPQQPGLLPDYRKQETPPWVG